VREKAVNRRTFLKMVGAAGAAAGCSRKAEPRKLVPYLVPPEDIVPGVPLFYRSVCRECSAGCGVTARTREGRVIKLEGNPEDPIGRGALCARGQAALQDLYAPDRLRGPMKRGGDGKFIPVKWDEALSAVVQALDAEKARPGAPGLRLLTRPEPGSAAALQRAFLSALGAASAQRVVFEPFDFAPLRAAGKLLFSKDEIAVPDLSRARSVISFGADFVSDWYSPVELSRQFAEGRGRVGSERTRLTWIGPRLSLTGASADSWIACRAGTELFVACGLLRWLCDPSNAVSGLAQPVGAIFSDLGRFTPEAVESVAGIPREALARLGRELADRRPSAVLGPGVISAGPEATRLATAVLLINSVLGNVGRTILYGLDPNDDPASPAEAVRALAGDMSSGKVSLLLLNHADPLGRLPSALGMAAGFDRVPLIVSFSDRLDATTQKAHLVLPDLHPLESFGDVTPRRGIIELGQPVMNPLWECRSTSQIVLDLMKKLALAPPATDVQAYIESRLPPMPAGSESAAARGNEAMRFAWERGGIYTPAAPQPVVLAPPPAGFFNVELPASGPGDFDLVGFPTVLRDGSLDAPWLKELPDPLTTISWSGWAEVSPKTAARLGIATGDTLQLSAPSGNLELPAYVYPGVREDTVGVPLADILPLLPFTTDRLSGGSAWVTGRVSLRRTGAVAVLPRLEGASDQRGREIIQSVSTAAPQARRHRPEYRMYPPPEFPRHRWAMAVDLDRCTGCQACIVACYAENNIPVNGAKLASQGRNQEWLRLERYFNAPEGAPAGDLGAVKVDFLLMLCQHCTNAPCESVCPVYATYHTSEGLNAQVYNRCVGTRYCSNNCPYKVRTFNWRDPDFPVPLDLQLNPDVSVRSKGVMEKCTFCVQRIRAAEIKAEGEKRPLRDGEVVTACAQTCPTGAIVFGDAHDPTSRVSALLRDERSYRVLEEINTEPAVAYLARVREESA
jgi:anaerobic selenocysteine-containing dehydrogenase/Fe-S-cluster-containing dehydrogenase component